MSEDWAKGFAGAVTKATQNTAASVIGLPLMTACTAAPHAAHVPCTVWSQRGTLAHLGYWRFSRTASSRTHASIFSVARVRACVSVCACASVWPAEATARALTEV